MTRTRTRGDPAADVERARWQLHHLAHILRNGWITTDLVNASRRARAAHQAREAARVAGLMALAQQLDDLAHDLTDDDILWLLAAGWDPLTMDRS